MFVFKQGVPTTLLRQLSLLQRSQRASIVGGGALEAYRGKEKKIVARFDWDNTFSGDTRAGRKGKFGRGHQRFCGNQKGLKEIWDGE